MFEYNYEKELQEHLFEHFNDYFDFECIGSEVRVFDGWIDLVGEDENNIYIIEVKKEIVTQDTIEQINRYIKSYKTDKNVIGIAIAPKKEKNIILDKYNNVFRIIELDDVYCTFETKSRFALSLEKELLQAIKIKAVKEDKPVNLIIDELLRDYLKREEEK